MAYENSSTFVDVHQAGNDFDYEFYVTVIRQKFYVVCFVFIILYGFIGNVVLLTSTVLWARANHWLHKGGLLSGFIINLTLAGLLWFSFLLPILLYIDVKLGPRWHLSEAACRLLNYANYVTVFGLIYSLLLLVIYQCVSVLCPRCISRYNNLRTALIACGLLWILLLIGNTVTAFQYQLVEFATDVNYCLLYHTSWESARRHILLRQAFTFTLPFLIMMCCSVYLIGTLCAPDSASLYQQLQDEDDDSRVGGQLQRRVSEMLVALTINFGVCCTPWAVAHVAVFLSPNNYEMLQSLAVHISLDIFYCLYKANPALNPIIIYICLRKELGRRPRRPPGQEEEDNVPDDFSRAETIQEVSYRRDENSVEIGSSAQEAGEDGVRGPEEGVRVPEDGASDIRATKD